MAKKLKRYAIQLVTGVNGEDVEFKTYYTVPFISTRVTYEGLNLLEEIDENLENRTKKESELLDQMAAFVADKAYGNQFTSDELIDGLHGPDAIRTLQEQVLFITNGRESDDIKKLVAKKN